MKGSIVNANLNKIFTDDVRVRGTASSLSVIQLIQDELASRERLEARKKSGRDKGGSEEMAGSMGYNYGNWNSEELKRLGRQVEV